MKAIIKHRKEQIEELKIKAQPIAHLVRWLTYDGLKINEEAALEFLETYSRMLTRELGKRKLKPRYQKKQQAFILKRYNKARFQIEHFNTNTHISIDDAGGRLYSPLTALPSIIRNFLSYNSQPLVGFDIKNSQPLHSLMMLRKEFWKKYTSGITLHKLDVDLYNYLLLSYHTTTTNIMFPIFAQMQAGGGFLMSNFLKLVQNGKLYEFICWKFFGKFLTKGGIDRFSTRNMAKKEVLRMMYFNPRERFSPSKAVFKEFKKHFPLEAEIMQLLKTRKHSDFSIMLQKIEARILLHNVAKRVYETNPNIPLFTIHDSILTTAEHQHTLRAILEQEYTKLIGFIPQMEFIEYSEDNAFRGLKKYVKGKIDQADLDISQENSNFPDSLKFLKCEHWNFPKEYNPTTIIPDFADYTTTSPGLKSTKSKKLPRSLKK